MSAMQTTGHRLYAWRLEGQLSRSAQILAVLQLRSVSRHQRVSVLNFLINLVLPPETGPN